MYNPLAPNDKRAKTVINSFFAIIGISLIILINEFWQIYSLDKNGGIVNENILQTIIDLTSGALYIANIIVFIMWFRRAYHNLEKIRVFTQYSEGWAAGFWFVPILNLIRPYQIMKEIWEKTQEATSGIIHYEPTNLIVIWWIFYLVNNFTELIIWPVLQLNSSMDSTTASVLSSAISGLINIAAAVVTLIMVKKMSAMETNLYNGVNSQQEHGEDLLGYVA